MSAVITSSDEIAYMVYKAAMQEELIVPKDLSVVALGGEDYLDRLSPRVTTAKIDYSLMGKKAIEMLLDKLNGKPIENNRVVFDASIKIGRSCAPYRAEFER